MKPNKITVVLVTFNSGEDITKALGSLRLQTRPLYKVIIVDNASSDDTINLIKRYWPPAKIIENKTNLGFAKAANQGIEFTDSEYVLLMNPDVILQKDFIENLLQAMKLDSNIATACGKLLRLNKHKGKKVIDSAGMVMTKSLRHLDRGSECVDKGQFEERRFVFGASGACMLARKAALKQVAIDGRIFDERFHSFREDADLAWRLQLNGWKCIYEPSAKGEHKRYVTPNKRKQLPDWINRQSVINRFLLRANNMTTDVYLKTAVSSFLRDILVAGACVTIERSSLPAFWSLAKMLPGQLEQRKKVQRLKKTEIDVAKWFDGKYTEPVLMESEK